MKIKVMFFAIAVLFSNFCLSQEKLVPSKKLTQGVYYLAGKDERMIIELKKGIYRYWFVSDFRLSHEPKYPLSGPYMFNNGVLILLIPICIRNHCRYDLKEWHTFLFNGKPTLWRPSAIESWQKNNDLDVYGILYLTQSDPKKLWENGWH
jgi:hypothetical protein